MTEPGLQRLQKIISEAGLASRREADKMIRDGEVTVNGKIAELGTKANPEKDHIKIRGKLLTKKAHKVAIVFFKPKGIEASLKPLGEADAVKNTIWEYLWKVREKVRPVGRLDTDAEGALLLTNDGDLLARLTASKFEVPKIYSIKIDGNLEDKKVRRLLGGITIEDKRVRLDKVNPKPADLGKQWVKVHLTHPQNRIVRKIFEAVGHPVDKVRREAFAGIGLRKLRRGEWRYLSYDEYYELRKFVGLES